MKKISLALIVFSLGIVMLFSGCLENPKEIDASNTTDVSGGAKESSTLDIQAIIESQKNIKNYSFYEKETIDSEEGRMITTMSGKMDIANKKAYMYMTDNAGRIFEMYLTGEEMYMKMSDSSGYTSGWIRVTKEEWESMNIGGMGTSDFGDMWNESTADQSFEILKEKSTGIIVLGDEAVNGIDCVKVQIIPDLKKMGEIYDIPSGSIKSIKMIYYIGKYNNYLAKVEAEEVQTDDSGGDVRIESTMTIKDWNSVSINLPEEVKNAKSFSEVMNELYGEGAYYEG